MSRALFTYVLVISLCLLTQYGTSREIRFLKGRVSVPVRHLDTDESTNSTIPSVSFNTAVLDQEHNEFAVPVSFGPDYTDDNSISTPNMLVLLYTNSTALSSTANDFQKFNCIAPCVIDDTNDKTTSLLSTTIDSFYVGTGAYISIANSAWTLNSSFMALNSITTNSEFQTNTAFYGWIGLGAAGDAMHNFPDHPLFSILFSNATTGAGEILFGKNITLTETLPLSASLATDGNWVMNIIDISFNNTDLTLNSEGPKMVFDLQFDDAVMSLPDNIYTELLSMSPFNETIDFPYYYTGNLSLLPDLVITVQGSVDTQQLKIPASVYMRRYNDTAYMSSWVKQDSLDVIILGWQFLANYYTFFERVEDQSLVVLYSTTVQNNSTPSDDGNSTIPDDNNSTTPTNGTIPTNNTTPTNGTTPTNDTTTSSSGGVPAWVWVIIALAVVIVAGVLFRRHQKKQAQAIEADTNLDKGLRSF